MKNDTIIWETQSLQEIKESIDSLQIRTSEGFSTVSDAILIARKDDLFLGVFTYNAVFATGATILVFAGGLIVNFLQKKKIERGQASSIREAFFSWIVLHRKAYQDQQDSFSDFLKTLSESKDIQEERLVVKFIQIKKLLDIPFLRLLNVFVSNSKGNKSENERSFFNLVNSLEFLVKFNDLVFEKYEEFRKGTEGIRNEWNEKFAEFDRIKVNITLTFSRSKMPELEVIAIEINQRTTNFFLNQDYGVNITFQVSDMIAEYFMPLRQYLITQMNSTPQVPEIQELSMIIEEIFVVFKKWTAWKSGFIQVFTSFQEVHDRTFKNVEEQLSHFKNNGLVTFWGFNGLN